MSAGDGKKFGLKVVTLSPNPTTHLQNKIPNTNGHQSTLGQAAEADAGRPLPPRSPASTTPPVMSRSHIYKYIP
jgi:hypothetical protein